MIRCHTYRDRPGQYDPLHVDLWWQGVNVLRDCGTFQYYVPERPDLEEYSGSPAAHNIMEIDRAWPFERVTRFLWFPWPRAKILQFQGDGKELLFEGERSCYARRPWNVILRRAVTSPAENEWMVTDEVLGQGSHRAVLRWHFCDVPYEVDEGRRTVILHTSCGPVRVEVEAQAGRVRSFEIIRGRDEIGKVQGFASEQYGSRTAIPTLEVEVEGTLPMRIVSKFTFAAL